MTAGSADYVEQVCSVLLGAAIGWYVTGPLLWGLMQRLVRHE